LASPASSATSKRSPSARGAPILTPLELLDRLAALLPQARIHRHRYFSIAF